MNVCCFVVLYYCYFFTEGCGEFIAIQNIVSANFLLSEFGLRLRTDANIQPLSFAASHRHLCLKKKNKKEMYSHSVKYSLICSEQEKTNTFAV